MQYVPRVLRELRPFWVQVKQVFSPATISETELNSCTLLRVAVSNLSRRATP